MSENVVEETKPNENRETAKVTPLDNNNNNNEVSEKVYSVPGENGKPRLKLRATARQLAGKDRQNAYDIKMAAKTAVEKIFSIYDVDNSGYLDPKELKSLLTKYNDGVAPDDETIIFIIRICDIFCSYSRFDITFFRFIIFYIFFTTNICHFFFFRLLLVDFVASLAKLMLFQNWQEHCLFDNVMMWIHLNNSLRSTCLVLLIHQMMYE